MSCVLRRAAVCGVFLLTLAGAVPAWAQVNTGEIFGKVTDGTGAVLPGATVTISSPALLQPQSVATSDSGGYRFPQIPIGTYSVTFDLPGFKKTVREDVVIQAGFHAEINARLELSSVQETVTVTGESPIVDTKSTVLGNNFVKDMLDKIPTARDPWVAIEQTPGITMTQQNVGGNTSGQQPGFSAHDTSRQVWTMDGGTMTDVSSNSSITYYDFDSFEEMQITTAGGDASIQNPGITVNLITKSGSNKFKGMARYFVTDKKFESLNISDSLRQQGAGGGNPVQNLQDFGGELGGPIAKNRAWFYAAQARNNIKVGVLGFYDLSRTDCVAVAANPLTFNLDQVNTCLKTDLTKLDDTNLKLQYQEAAAHKTTYGWTRGGKYRGSRDSSQFNAIETTHIQHGPTNIYRLDHQWIVSNRFTLSGMYTQVDGGFFLDWQDPSLQNVQQLSYVDTGYNYRSTDAYHTIRTSKEIKTDGNFFLSKWLGGDHAMKFGYRYRQTPIESTDIQGGGAIVRIRASGKNEANIIRESHNNVARWEESAYYSDSYKTGRATVNWGTRYDRYWDEALAASTAANPILPDYLPGINFQGATSGIVWNNFAPRLGFTYDVRGNGKTILKSDVGRFYQIGAATAGTLQPTGQTTLRFFWTDQNGDLVIQRNELDLATGFIATPSSNYDPANPSAVKTPATIAADLKNTITDELVVGLDHELMRNFGVGVSYIYRNYHQNRGTFRVGALSAEYAPVTFSKACGNSSCTQPTYSGTYFQRATALPATTILRNDGTYTVYQGLEFTARKRLSNKWMLNGSFTYNHGIFWEPQADRDYLDPTNVALVNGQSDGVVPWVAKLSGLYTLPWNIGVSAFLNTRSGFTYNTTIQSPTRTGGGGTVNVLLQTNGALTYPTFSELDLNVDKTIPLGAGRRLVLQMAVFNLTNAATVFSRVTRQDVSNANNVTNVLAPRVARFGIRLNF
jgi:Carboxypeptidase regulatory-like domain